MPNAPQVKNLCVTSQVAPVPVDSTSRRSYGAAVFSENYSLINGPVQLKPVCFKDQLTTITRYSFHNTLRK